MRLSCSWKTKNTFSKGFGIIKNLYFYSNPFESTESEGQVPYLKLQAVLVVLLGSRGNSVTKMELIYVCVSLYQCQEVFFFL